VIDRLRKLTTTTLLLFVAASIGMMISNEVSTRAMLADDARPAVEEDGSREPASNSVADDAPVQEGIPVLETTPTDEPPPVVAYYFHNTQRCVTCLRIEQAAKEAMETAFATELSDGRLVWSSLNMQQPENLHFVDEYDLPFPSVVLTQGNEWVLLDQTWTLIRDREAFDAYVIDSAREFLEITNE